MDSRRSIQLQKIATWRTQRGGTRGGFSRAQGQGFRTAPQSRGPIHGSAGHTGPPDPFHRQQRQRQGLLPAPTIHRGKSPCLMHVSRSHPGGKWTALNPKTMVIMKTWHIQQIDSNPALQKNAQNLWALSSQQHSPIPGLVRLGAGSMILIWVPWEAGIEFSS